MVACARRIRWKKQQKPDAAANTENKHTKLVRNTQLAAAASAAAAAAAASAAAAAAAAAAAVRLQASTAAMKY